MRFHHLLLGSLLFTVGCGEGGDDRALNMNQMGPGGSMEMVDYPTGNLGAAVGQQVANLSFLWLQHGAADVGKEPARVTMADFYAMGKKGEAKLLFLSGAAEWCAPCVAEAGYLVRLLSDMTFQQYLAAQGGPKTLQVFQVIMQDINRNPATRDVMEAWAKEHKANFAVGIDPKAQVSGYIPQSSIPQSLFIRLSDMTLVHREIGALDQAGLNSRFRTCLENLDQVGKNDLFESCIKKKGQ